MKKLCTSLSLFCVMTALCQAQVVTDAGTFTKPQFKDMLWEINFSPNLTGNVGMFSLPFLSQGSDIVVIKGRKFIADRKAIRGMGNVSFNNDGKVTDYTAALGAGIEKHRAGKERLSTYWGYGAAIGYHADTKIKNQPNGNKVELTNTTLGYSASMFSGFDYYIMPDIYLGLELNYGFGVSTYNPEVGKTVTSFNFAPGVSSSLRLGWKL